MGWDEYFVRKGHPVYVPDQVGRGRSGFNQAVFNNVRAGVGAAGQPSSLAAIQRRGRLAELPLRLEAWRAVRGQSVPGDRRGRTRRSRASPTSALAASPHPNPTLKALSDLASQVNGAVLMGHSQSGAFPLAAALLNPAAAKGLVLVEPGGCPAELHRRADQDAGDDARFWSCSAITATRRRASAFGPRGSSSFESCQALIGRLKSGRRPGGDAQPGRDAASAATAT